MEQNHPETNVTTVITKSDLPELCNIEYPGIIENPAAALRSLGGIKRVSEVFAHYPQKKLELKYRPGDVFSNPVYGTGRTTCGILLSVRRKKNRNGQYDPSSTTVSLIPPQQHYQQQKQQQAKNMESTESNLIDLDELDQENNDQKFISLMSIQPDDILPEDIQVNDKTITAEPSSSDSQGTKVVNMFKRKILKEEAQIQQIQLQESLRNPELEKLTETNLTCQQQNKIEIKQRKFHVPQNKSMEVKALAVVGKLFNFDGLSNFQYLPIARAENEGEYISIASDIFPGFGDPENGKLYETAKMETGERETFPFCPPLLLSKIDTPMPNLFRNTQPVPKNINDTLLVIEEDAIISKRNKRSVNTSIASFKENDKVNIPLKPHPQALGDATSKLLTGEKLNTVKELFESRPVWSKIALEWETKYTANQLKYILPCVAYYSLNGPWRSLWIKFGYDPRKDKGAFIYQLIDYRLPFQYRTYQVIDQADEESYHKFKSDKIPPKAQMFFQLCDLEVSEIQQLAGAMSIRLHNPDEMTYNPKYGFLDEDIIEFCRYCMTRCVEVRLHSLGKIKAITVPAISLETGFAIPVEQLRTQPRKKPNKRNPRNTNSKQNGKVMLPKKKTPLALQNLADLFEDDEEEEEEKEKDKCQKQQNNDASIRELVRRALYGQDEEEQVQKRRSSRLKSILEPSENSGDSFGHEDDPLYVPDEFYESSD